MKKIRFCLFSCLLAGLIFPTFAGASNRVKNIKLWNAPVHVRIVVEMDEKPKYRKSTLNDGKLIVVDIPNASFQEGYKRIPLKDKYVKRLSISQFSTDVVRLVVTLKKKLDFKVTTAGKYNEYGPRLIINIDKISEPGTAVLKTKNNNLPLIVIDPGHGGEDPGALGKNGLKEKDVVLSIAKKLKDKLEREKLARVILTRSEDYYVSLEDRVKIAEANQACLFLSLHTNASKISSASGTSVFFLSRKGASDRAAQILADKENAADIIGGECKKGAEDVVKSIVLDLKQHHNNIQSGILAGIVLKNLKKIIKRVDRGVRQAGFAVLKSISVPSILVELAFITNPTEERLLREEKFQNDLVKALKLGIEDFLKQTVYLAKAAD